MNEIKTRTLEGEIESAYRTLKTSYVELDAAKTLVLNKKRALEYAKGEKYLAGEISGTNDTLRKANELSVLSKELIALYEAEKLESECTLTYVCAQFDIDLIKWKIRLGVGMENVDGL